MILSKAIIPLLRTALPFISRPALYLPISTPLRSYVSAFPKMHFSTESKTPPNDEKAENKEKTNKEEIKKEETNKEEEKKEEAKEPEEEKDPKELELEVIH